MNKAITFTRRGKVETRQIKVCSLCGVRLGHFWGFFGDYPGDAQVIEAWFCRRGCDG